MGERVTDFICEQRCEITDPARKATKDGKDRSEEREGRCQSDHLECKCKSEFEKGRTRSGGAYIRRTPVHTAGTAQSH